MGPSIRVMSILGLSVVVVGRTMGMISILGPTMVMGLRIGIKSTIGPTMVVELSIGGMRSTLGPTMGVGVGIEMRSIMGPTMAVRLSMGVRSTMVSTRMVRSSTRCCGDVGFVIVMGLMEESTILRGLTKVLGFILMVESAMMVRWRVRGFPGVVGSTVVWSVVDMGGW